MGLGVASVTQEVAKTICDRISTEAEHFVYFVYFSLLFSFQFHVSYFNSILILRKYNYFDRNS